MEFAKLSAPSLKDLFVQQLQGMILSDELPMGTQLPPERELAQQMQVSRAVVNGGLAELAQQGFLEVRPRQGTFVADYRRKGNLSTLIAIMEYQGGVLGKDEIRSILEVRRALEHLAAQRAIRYASDEALARLGDIVARIAAAQNNAQAAEAAPRASAKDSTPARRLRRPLPSITSLRLRAATAFCRSSTIRSRRPLSPCGCVSAACTASARFAATRKRCTITCAGGTWTERSGGSTRIWSRPSTAASRFTRNGEACAAPPAAKIPLSSSRFD